MKRGRYSICWNAHQLELGRRTSVMGVLNVTPDSFSDGGIFHRTEEAIAQGCRMADEGADILDIGGESTRPFSETVDVKEEIRRVAPVIEALAHRVSVPISIDTMKAAVAARAIDAGASIINDVSALRYDPKLGELAARHGLPVILMHMKGSPKTMQIDPVYEDLMGEIKAFLGDAILRAQELGISKSKVLIDPGIGFGKTIEHNLQIIARLQELSDLDAPLLVGSSRKAFIRKILKDNGQEEMAPLHPDVARGTQATVAASVLNGAHVVRVHDVASTRITVKIVDAVAESGPPSVAYRD